MVETIGDTAITSIPLSNRCLELLLLAIIFNSTSKRYCLAKLFNFYDFTLPKY